MQNRWGALITHTDLLVTMYPMDTIRTDFQLDKSSMAISWFARIFCLFEVIGYILDTGKNRDRKKSAMQYDNVDYCSWFNTIFTHSEKLFRAASLILCHWIVYFVLWFSFFFHSLIFKTWKNIAFNSILRTTTVKFFFYIRNILCESKNLIGSFCSNQ